MKSGAWTDDEEDLLLEYAFKYKSVNDIARALNRTPQSIATKLKAMRDKGYSV